MTEHAILSPSGADRWLNCPPSARLEEKINRDSDTLYAREGTLAHDLGEVELLRLLGRMTNDEYLKRFNEINADDLFTDEMEEQVEKYTSYVIEEYNSKPGATILIEQKIDLTEFVPEGFGTGDAVIINDGVLEIIDLKYGKGVRVNSGNNSQLMLYGAGAYERFELSYDIKDIKLTIIQPRLDHHSSWTVAVEDLTRWVEKIVKPKAELAIKGEGLQQAGEHCRWCSAKPQCATLASYNLKIAQHDFKDPHLLTDAQLIQVYKQMPVIADWIKSVANYLLEEAEKGKKWPGHKLVEGRSNRTWADPDKVIELLKSKKFKVCDIVNQKIKGIGDIEKLLGKTKFSKILGEYIIKPQGKPTLVPESDKRPAINSLDQAKQDFNQ